MLKYFDSDIREEKFNKKNITSIRSSILLHKDQYNPGDISSAALFMVAEASVKGSDVIRKNVG